MERRSFLCGAGAGAPLLFENRSGSGSAAPFSGLERERERRSFELERCPPLVPGHSQIDGKRLQTRKLRGQRYPK